MIWSGGIEGIDVSRHQKGLDFAAIPDSYRFVIAKATEGTDYLDPEFYRFAEQTRDRGLVFGAYHFARPSSNGGGIDDARSEALCFAQAINCAGGVDLPPWIDFEEYSPNGPDENRTWIREFVRVIEEETGWSPGIYTGRNVWKYEVGNSTEFDHLPIWLVAYSKNKSVPKFLGRTPELWQWSGGSRFAYGSKIGGRTVDLNRFTGSDFSDLTEKRIRRPWSRS